jgi:putative SOS response-associated peptidase YedK
VTPPVASSPTSTEWRDADLGGILRGMCGRVTIQTPPQAIARELGLAGVRSALERPRYNLAPTQLIPVVLNDGERMLDAVRWGLIPSWAKEASIGNKLINARGETVAEKPSFRSALKRRRCLVLVDGWFEWKQATKPKTPYLFKREDGRPLAFAGLWEEWTAVDTGEVLRTCAVITTGPNALMAPIHDRMPVILDEAAQRVWLRPEPQEASVLQPLLVPNEDQPLVAWEVGRVVNSPTNDVAACVERVAAPPTLL